MADFDAQLPVRALATNFTTEVANSSGTTIDPAEEFAQGSTTSGQHGPLIQAAVTTAAPSYTTGQTSPLSLTTAGSLRIDGSGSTQPVSGTVTANQGTPNTAANKWPIEIVDSGGVNIATVNATNELLVTDTDLTLSQGSTTSGQLGPLIQGAVTTSNPSYTTGQTDPLSLTTAGALRTDIEQVGGSALSLGQKVMASSIPVVIASDQSAINVNFFDTTIELISYNTASSVAANASNTHSFTPGSTISLDEIDASSSGQMKVEIQWGTTGSETTKNVFFTSKGHLQGSFKLSNPVSITSAMTIKVIRTNTDNQAQDLYSTIQYH